MAHLLSRSGRRQPYELFDEVRATGASRCGLTGVWIIAGHDDVRRLLHSDELASPARTTVRAQSEAWSGSDTLRGLNHMLFLIDGDDHEATHQTFMEEYRDAVRGMRPEVPALVAGELDRAADDGELHLRHLTENISMHLICDLAGIGREHGPFLWSCSDALIPLLGFNLSAAKLDALGTQVQMIEELMERRELISRPGMVEDWIAAGLPADVVIGLLASLVSGLLNPLRAGLHTAVVRMLSAVELHEAVRSDEDLAGRVLAESLRIEAPVQWVGRQMQIDQEIGEHLVGAGQFVLLLLGAANRDPRAFDRPASFVIDRPRGSAVLSFGSGTHRCVGEALTKWLGVELLQQVACRVDPGSLGGSAAWSTTREGFRAPLVDVVPAGCVDA